MSSSEARYTVYEAWHHANGQSSRDRKKPPLGSIPRSPVLLFKNQSNLSGAEPQCLVNLLNCEAAVWSLSIFSEEILPGTMLAPANMGTDDQQSIEVLVEAREKGEASCATEWVWILREIPFAPFQSRSVVLNFKSPFVVGLESRQPRKCRQSRT